MTRLNTKHLCSTVGGLSFYKYNFSTIPRCYIKHKITPPILTRGYQNVQSLITIVTPRINPDPQD